MIRTLDILFSAIALVLLSPILIPIAIVLRFTGEREVFYKQTRVGYLQRRFQLWKFATMLKDSPNIGTGVMTVKDDPRILPMGGFLRKTKINELPQLVNVLRGDMSLIGPRPQAEKVFEFFPPPLRETITMVPPGLSGVGSILFRDEESIIGRSANSAEFYANVISPYKAEVESWFARNRSVALYFKLIFLTLWVIVSPKSKLPRRLLLGLPQPPPALQQAMNHGE